MSRSFHNRSRPRDDDRARWRQRRDDERTWNATRIRGRRLSATEREYRQWARQKSKAEQRANESVWWGEAIGEQSQIEWLAELKRCSERLIWTCREDLWPRKSRECDGGSAPAQ